jgi:hypothetical protein
VIDDPRPGEVDGSLVLASFLAAARADLDGMARRAMLYASAFRELQRIGAGPEDPRRLLLDLLAVFVKLRQLADRFAAIEAGARGEP